MNFHELRNRKWNLGSTVILCKYVTYTAGLRQIDNYNNQVAVHANQFTATLLAETTMNGEAGVFVLTLSEYGVLWLFKEDCDLLCE